MPFFVFTHWGAFYTSSTSCPGLISFQVYAFGFESECIHGITVKYMKGNTIEKGFSTTNVRGRGIQTERGCLRAAQGSSLTHPKDGLSSRLKSVSSSHWNSHFFFPLPLRAWLSTTARIVSSCSSRTRVPVLIAVVVALGLVAVSYDEEVSERIVHFSCRYRNSPMQVRPTPLSSCLNLVVIGDNIMYGKSVLALVRV